jgi:purine-binding chemotaxis protein CheW
VSELKNVIVFALGGARYAAELRWVREVIALGFVTAVPTAPRAIAGVVNLRGAITAVIDLAAAEGRPPSAPPRQGDGALVLEVDGTAAALRVDKVDEVASLRIAPGEAAVLDGRGRRVPLVDPPGLVRRALSAAHATRGDDDPLLDPDSSDPDHSVEMRAVDDRGAPDPVTGLVAPLGDLDLDTTHG